MTLVKICGVTLADDAAHASAAGADFLGLNFWKRSKRYLAPARAPFVAAAARGAGAAKLVGVFVDADVEDIVAMAREVALDAVQLHGDDSPATVAEVATATGLPVWKAIAVRSAADVAALQIWPVAAILLDAPTPQRGGAGVGFDHAIARDARQRYPALRFVLAGGLDPVNVGAAIATVAPWCVDVASGVELAAGIKDPVKVVAFVAAAHAPP